MSTSIDRAIIKSAWSNYTIKVIMNRWEFFLDAIRKAEHFWSRCLKGAFLKSCMNPELVQRLSKCTELLSTCVVKRLLVVSAVSSSKVTRCSAECLHSTVQIWETLGERCCPECLCECVFVTACLCVCVRGCLCLQSWKNRLLIITPDSAAAG